MKRENKPPAKLLIPPTPNPPAIPKSSASRTQGYICTCLKSWIRTVFIASVREGLSACEPAVFWPEPAGRAFADTGGVAKVSYFGEEEDWEDEEGSLVSPAIFGGLGEELGWGD